MDIAQILIFLLATAIYALVVPPKWRAWLLLLMSLLSIYWLQPTLNIRWLDYSLPTVTVLLSVVGWYWTRPPDATALTRRDIWTLIVVLGVLLLLTLTRYVEVPPQLQLTSRPPEWFSVLFGAGLALVAAWFMRRVASQAVVWLGMVCIVLLFVIIKTEALSVVAAQVLRGQAGQNPQLASALDLNWLGFSYVAFRLLHTLRDRQTNLLPPMDLRTYLTFVIFFPAYVAGPIDRAERFQKDYDALLSLKGLDAQRITTGVTRVLIGMFKKFVIADSLALFALNSTLADAALSTSALWVMLYAYALRLFFDFSGYSDIAIGIGLLFGIRLPENFDRPYTKQNITAFWQSWHMSLSNWVRFYVFTPLSRTLLRNKRKPSNEVIMLVCHLTTMLVMGLWHGVGWSFAVWGMWHGVGLWVHKLWSDRTRKWYRQLQEKPRQKRIWSFFTWFLTLHYVVLGWVWFALPSFDAGTRTLLRLFGGTP